MRAVHFREYVPEASPECIIPGNAIATEKPESTSTSLSAQDGGTFVMYSKFWLIVVEFARVYYQPGRIPVKNRVSFQFAEAIYQKLLRWMDDTAIQVQGETFEKHHQAILQCVRVFIHRQIGWADDDHQHSISLCYY